MNNSFYTPLIKSKQASSKIQNINFKQDNHKLIIHNKHCIIEKKERMKRKNEN